MLPRDASLCMVHASSVMLNVSAWTFIPPTTPAYQHRDRADAVPPSPACAVADGSLRCPGTVAGWKISSTPRRCGCCAPAVRWWLPDSSWRCRCGRLSCRAGARTDPACSGRRRGGACAAASFWMRRAALRRCRITASWLRLVGPSPVKSMANQASGNRAAPFEPGHIITS